VRGRAKLRSWSMSEENNESRGGAENAEK